MFRVKKVYTNFNRIFKEKNMTAQEFLEHYASAEEWELMSKALDDLDKTLYYDGFNDGYNCLLNEFKDSFIELYKLMADYLKMWDARKDLTELEELALRIVAIGRQDLGAFIDKNKDTYEVGF